VLGEEEQTQKQSIGAIMLSIEENELLTRTGPGTPMGELLRHYWHPICAVDDLERRPLRTKEIKVMDEELVLYRDRSGQLGLVDKYCAHRRASLAYGVVEEDGIRCQYHGWKYDETGRCIEQPFEDTTHPEDNFRAKCTLTSYKVQELCGFIFAYMGPEPAPLLPRWGPLIWEDAVRDITSTVIPCNWLQCQENSLDPIHTEHLHFYAGTYFKEVLNDKEPTFSRVGKHEKIQFDAFKHGIIKRRVQSGNTEESSPWKYGHPALFPNILLQGSPNNNLMQFRVPQDDTHTLHFSLYTWRVAPGAEVPKQDVIPSRSFPLFDDSGEMFLQIFFHQDYMAWMTQGPILQRELEKLGESDKGIILFRKMLAQQLEIVRDGGKPTVNFITDPTENEGLEPPNVPLEVGRGRDNNGGKYTPSEFGFSRDADKIEAAMASWQRGAEAESATTRG
jgi:5,5'-dehydrodivanillate O-demethylase